MKLMPCLSLWAVWLLISGAAAPARPDTAEVLPDRYVEVVLAVEGMI